MLAWVLSNGENSLLFDGHVYVSFSATEQLNYKASRKMTSLIYVCRVCRKAPSFQNSSNQLKNYESYACLVYVCMCALCFVMKSELESWGQRIKLDWAGWINWVIRSTDFCSGHTQFPSNSIKNVTYRVYISTQ